MVNTIASVVNNCRICQKYHKYVVRPKIPKLSSFNEVVTLDLKEIGSKYILWMVHSFTKFIQGKLINNKKAETVIDAINSAWNYNIGYHSVDYFTDNRGEFVNIKLDKLTSKLSLSVKLSPSYSPLSNGINKCNHDSADMTIWKT